MVMQFSSELLLIYRLSRLIFISHKQKIYVLSQNSLLNPSPRLIKPDLFSAVQTLLQRTPNRHSLHGTRQLHRQRLVLQDTLRKFIRLDHKRLLEAAIVVTRNLPAHAGTPAAALALIDAHQIQRRVGVDGELARRADDLRGVVLARGHHARRVQVGDAAAVELDDADCVVDVGVLAQRGLHGRDAGGDDGLDEGVLPEEPEG
jgi:hypothetical protein